MRTAFRLGADEPGPQLADGDVVAPENGADQPEPAEEPIQWVPGYPAAVPLKRIQELPNPVESELPENLDALFGVPEPLGIFNNSPGTPDQYEEIEDQKQWQEQEVDQGSPLTIVA